MSEWSSQNQSLRPIHSHFSYPGKIVYTQTSTETVTISGSYAPNSGVNNKVIIYETAKTPDTYVLYGKYFRQCNLSGNSATALL
jgi:hypothetical protein